MQTVSREMRGRQTCEKGTEIERIDADTYCVASQSGNGFYQALYSSPQGWKCSCPDCMNRAIKCKHVGAVEFSASLRQAVQARTEEAVTIEPVDVSSCQFYGSENIVRDGVRYNKAGNIQVYSCRGCNHYFSQQVDNPHSECQPSDDS